MYPKPRKRKQHVSRRTLLGYGLGAAAMAPLLPSLGRVFADEDPGTPRLAGGGKAKQVVILFMNGGASHLETFDPKPGTSEGGPTRTIPTASSGVHIAQSLPLIAKQMNEICLVRSMSTKEGNHERARYLMHTGYAPTPTVTHPSIGATLSHELGDADAALPNYIAVNGPGAKPGFLGARHAPFSVRVNAPQTGKKRGRPDRRRGSRAVVENMEAPKSVTPGRRDNRLELVGTMNDRFAKDRGDGVKNAQDAMFERARMLMDSPQNSAFDVVSESADAKRRYGETQFGLGCLMARRLIDEGVKCVEVNMGGWDTHDDGFERVKTLNSDLDRGAASLLTDLRASGKLDETLVLWVGDFGRTPKISATNGRGHYPRAWSAWLAGGGVQGGRVVGSTDESGATVTERPVSETDLFASIAHATGFDKDKTFFSNGRPITLVYETGTVVPELFQS